MKAKIGGILDTIETNKALGYMHTGHCVKDTYKDVMVIVKNKNSKKNSVTSYAFGTNLEQNYILANVFHFDFLEDSLDVSVINK